MYDPLSKELFYLKKTDTPKICLKNMQTAFVSYVFSCYTCIYAYFPKQLRTINATSVKIVVHV